MFSSYFIDRLYKEIAFGKTDYALTIITFVTLIFLSLTIISALALIFFDNIISKEISKIENQPEKDNELSKKIYTNKKGFFYRFRNISLIVLSLFALSMIVASHIEYSSIMIFEQYMKIITPYISQSDKDLLISKFASMRTYKDYEKIMDEIGSHAKKNKIILPEQLYVYTY